MSIMTLPYRIISLYVVLSDLIIAISVPLHLRAISHRDCLLFLKTILNCLFMIGTTVYKAVKAESRNDLPARYLLHTQTPFLSSRLSNGTSRVLSLVLSEPSGSSNLTSYFSRKREGVSRIPLRTITQTSPGRR